MHGQNHIKFVPEETLILLLHSNGVLFTSIMLDISVVSLLESSSAYVETEGFSGYDYFVLMTAVWVAIEVGPSIDAAPTPETTEEPNPEMSYIYQSCPTYKTEGAFVTNV